jgi:hypothetical protein
MTAAAGRVGAVGLYWLWDEQSWPQVGVVVDLTTRRGILADKWQIYISQN